MIVADSTGNWGTITVRNEVAEFGAARTAASE
jgi:hypothetical protein